MNQDGLMKPRRGVHPGAKGIQSKPAGSGKGKTGGGQGECPHIEDAGHYVENRKSLVKVRVRMPVLLRG